MPEHVEAKAKSALIVLIAGASAMGKSYVVGQLQPQDGFAQANIDKFYTIAVREAGMVDAAAGQSAEAAAQAEADARRSARDRRWPSETTEAEFFASLSRQFKFVLKKAAQKQAIAIIDGGTLSRMEEIRLLVKHALRVHRQGVRIVRIFVEAPYERWLENRVLRAVEFRQETLRLASLAAESYVRLVAAAKPAPHRRIEDIAVKSSDEALALIRSIADAARAGAENGTVTEPLRRQNDGVLESSGEPSSHRNRYG